MYTIGATPQIAQSLSHTSALLLGSATLWLTISEFDTILVSGGYYSSSRRELTYFRPDAAAGEELVQPNGALSIDRFRHTSGPLPDGKAIIVGGPDGNPSTSSDVFDPATETVVAGPNMAQSRYAPSGASLDGKFYVCGGYSANRKQCKVYDPALNNWQSIANSEFNHDHTDLGKRANEQNYSVEVGGPE